MNKTFVSIACAAALLTASVAFAQEGASFDSSVAMPVPGVPTISVTQMNTGPGAPMPTSFSTEGRPMQIQIQGSAPIPMGSARTMQIQGQGVIAVPVAGMQPMPNFDNQAPNPPRKTNRQIIELRRSLDKLPIIDDESQNEGNMMYGQRMDNSGGPTRGVVQVSEGMPGRPASMRASSTIGGAPRDMMIRTGAASGSGAVFMRTEGGTTNMQWQGGDQNMQPAGRITTTTTPDGNIVYTFETQKKPQIRAFFDQVFNLFNKATGEVPAAQTFNFSF